MADGLAIRERTLVLLAASTGLRQSELFGLKWGDIDFAQGTMNVTRSIVCGFVGPCKTESSQKPVPIHPVIVDALEKWKAHHRYRQLDDWVFASGSRRGRQPYWGQAILRKYIRPKPLELGIEKRFGWHTFRHTYSTLLRSVGTEFKVMQEITSTLFSAIDAGRLHPGDYPSEARRPGRRNVPCLFFAIRNGRTRVVPEKTAASLYIDHWKWGAKGTQFCGSFAPH